MKCQYCGKEIDDNARFCPNCGREQVKPKEHRCTRCGALLEPDAKFCPNCGQKVEAPETPINPGSSDEQSRQSGPNGQSEPKPYTSPSSPSTPSAPPTTPPSPSSPAKKKSSKRWIVAAVLVVVAAGLWYVGNSLSGKGDIQYMPFRESEDGRWGLISTDGKVLFSEEFKDQPTVVMRGRFFVRNADGKYELYEAGKKPKLIGTDTYDQAGVFIENVAPVVMEGKPIQFIDRNGKVKFTLDKADGLTVDNCTNFSDGVAVFKAGKYYGCVNTKGDIVVKPKYAGIAPASEGRILTIDKNDLGDSANVDMEKVTCTVLSTSGKVIGKISQKNFMIVRDGMLHSGAFTIEDHDGNQGLINEKGEYILRPTDKIKDIREIRDKKFVYYDGESYGLMNFDGEVLIRPKYKFLRFAGKDGLLWARLDENSDNDMILINYNDERQSQEKYIQVLAFHGSHAAVQDEKDNWVFINANGEVQASETAIYDITDSNQGIEWLESQYFDADDYVAALDIQSFGFLGLQMSDNASRLADKIHAMDDVDFSDEPAEHSYESGLNFSTRIGKISTGVAAVFTENVVEQYDDNGDYHPHFKDITPTFLALSVGNVGIKEAQLRQITAAMIKKVKSFGSTVSENRNAVVVRGQGDYSYFVAFSGQGVFLYMGQFDPDSIDISSLSDVSEDNPHSLPDFNYGYDTVVDDSTALDTVSY